MEAGPDGSSGGAHQPLSGGSSGGGGLCGLEWVVKARFSELWALHEVIRVCNVMGGESSL